MHLLGTRSALHGAIIMIVNALMYLKYRVWKQVNWDTVWVSVVRRFKLKSFRQRRLPKRGAGVCWCCSRSVAPELSAPFAQLFRRQSRSTSPTCLWGSEIKRWGSSKPLNRTFHTCSERCRCQRQECVRNESVAQIWLQSSPTQSEGEISFTQDSSPAKKRQDQEVRHVEAIIRSNTNHSKSSHFLNANCF